MRRFVRDIDRRMIAQEITRVALADKIGTSPAYVTKALRGDVNFTLESMTKLALAVGGRLNVEVVDRRTDDAWDTVHLQRTSVRTIRRVIVPDEFLIAANECSVQRVAAVGGV
jgi:hypothetical protein